MTGRPPRGLATDYGGARHVPPLRPSPKGARLPGSAPACRRSVVSNASRDPAGGSSAAKRAAHLPLIGGQYRPLTREGVALVQAITIPPSKEVGPLRDRGRETGHPSGGCSRTRRFKGPAEPRSSPRLHHGGGPQALRGPGRHARFRRRGRNAVVPTSPPRHGQVAPPDARKRAPRATMPGPLVPQAASHRRAAGSFHTVAHRALPSASIHSPAGSKRLRRLEMACRGLAPQHPPSVRPQSSGPTASGHWSTIRKRHAILYGKSMAGAADNSVPPPSFFPLWTPPFPLPPLKLETTKGGQTQGGNTAGGTMAR